MTGFSWRRSVFSGPLVAALLALLAGCSDNRGRNATPTDADPDAEEWISLFDGRDLSRWTPKITGREAGDNFGQTFRVEDGVLKVRYDAYDRFDSDFGVLVYDEPFSYYRLVVEYRFTGDQLEGGPEWALRNSGIMIHSQSAESMGIDQDFPISIEVQLLGGTGDGPRPTANLCTPGTHVVMDGELVTNHCINSTSDTFDGDQWVSVEVVALGDSLITHFVNGGEVLRYTAPQIGGGNVSGHDPSMKVDGRLLTGGYIGLQSESHPLEFRRVDLLRLSGCTDPEAANYKSYFVHSDPAVCRYEE
jgi:hypothetical protein